MPPHAWSLNFFYAGCSRFGRLEDLHDVTKQRRHLDEAYVRVSIGLASIGRIMTYNIDGPCFKIRVEEIRCMDNLNHLQVLADSASEATLDTSSEVGWSGVNSVLVTLGFRPNTDDSDGETVQGGPNAPHASIAIRETATTRNVKSRLAIMMLEAKFKLVLVPKDTLMV